MSTVLEKDKPRNSAIGIAVLVCIAAIVGMIVAVQIMFEFEVRGEIERKVLDLADARLATLRKQEAFKLSNYQWVETDDVVRIPVDEAVKLTLRDWASRPDAPRLAPVEGTPPAGAAPAAAPSAPAAAPTAPAAAPKAPEIAKIAVEEHKVL